MKTEEILQTIKTFEETLKRYKSDLEKIRVVHSILD
jgi:hypothetical protein